MTLDELLAAYLAHLRALNYSERTVKKADLLLAAFLRWLRDHAGVDLPQQLHRDHLDLWQRSLATRRNAKGLPLKPVSINGSVSKARGFLRYLAERGHVPKKLAAALQSVKEPKMLPQSVLTHAQVKKLLRGVTTGSPEGYRHRAVLELLYSSGLRAAELLGLDVDDVDLGAAAARVTGKGNKQRMVPIGKSALRHLQSYLSAVRPYLVRDPGERALFLTAQGGRYPYHALRRMVRGYADKAGISIPVTPHTFRRSCTTEMVRAGAGLYHVKEMLGHETLNTLRNYTRLTINDLKATHAKCHPSERSGSV